MWIPHTIPKTTFNLFCPANEVMLLPNEIGRAIKSDDFSWANQMPKALKYMCLDSISENFQKFPKDLFKKINLMNTVYLSEKLPTSLSLVLVIHVPDGEYWKRRCNDFWPNFSELHNNSVESFKVAFISEYVSQTIENLVPGYVDKQELTEILLICNPYITTLNCKKLCIPGSLLHEMDIAESGELPEDPVHVELDFILHHLPRLREVKLVYGMKSCIEEDYTPDQFKFNIKDMDTLGQGLVTLPYLSSLSIVKSALDVIKFNRLSLYLSNCHLLEHLDFSYCLLETLAAKSISNFIKFAKMLKSINLFCNDIGPEGAEALAYVALWRGQNYLPNLDLNLGMNKICDLGAQYLASAIASGVQPFSALRISNCMITQNGGLKIIESIQYDQGLKILQLDNNFIGLKAGVELHKILIRNTNIEYLSTYNCGLTIKLQKFLAKVAFYNKYKKRSILDYTNIEELIKTETESKESVHQINQFEEDTKT
ncbi:uncharacterized protein LOC126896309 [Daktulosphaira vitifoliae]|uniref:uncharacterized protein LOC126896309 n=1 Tax=Daktulosphaira vitifoliae TaxID=58002 RepID=UPI0021AAE456|nr:uncharacterized protein LOC126896309 [Daktulosphaira vitifoliae]